MNFANNLAQRVKKTSQIAKTKTLKRINPPQNLELKLEANSEASTQGEQSHAKKSSKQKQNTKTVEEQIKSLTTKINKLKQSQTQSSENISTINTINQEISGIVSNIAQNEFVPSSSLIINQKLNFKIEKLKTNKLQLQKVIKTSKVATKAFFTTIDESMFIKDYIAPDYNLTTLDPIIEILIPITSELVNTVVYHNSNDELYGYHVLEQNNIISNSKSNKKTLMLKSADLWSELKKNMGMSTFSLKEVKQKKL